MKNPIAWSGLATLIALVLFGIVLKHADTVPCATQDCNAHLLIFIAGVLMPCVFICAVWFIRSLSEMRRTRKHPVIKSIPENLDAAIEALAAMGVKDIDEWKDMKEEDATAHAHHMLGQWLRNEWGLWGDNKLTAWFNGLGIKHPDDMSDIILTSFHRVLNHNDIELNEQVAKHRKYWEDNDPRML